MKFINKKQYTDFYCSLREWNLLDEIEDKENFVEQALIKLNNEYDFDTTSAWYEGFAKCINKEFADLIELLTHNRPIVKIDIETFDDHAYYNGMTIEFKSEEFPIIKLEFVDYDEKPYPYYDMPNCPECSHWHSIFIQALDAVYSTIEFKLEHPCEYKKYFNKNYYAVIKGIVGSSCTEQIIDYFKLINGDEKKY